MHGSVHSKRTMNGHMLSCFLLSVKTLELSCIRPIVSVSLEILISMANYLPVTSTGTECSVSVQHQ